MSTWYQKCMPQIKDVKKHLSQTIEDIKKSEYVSSIYVWGSVAENYNVPKFRIRDIDVIAITDFHSGDLLAVDNEILRQKFSQEELENQGYNPSVLKFSEEFLSFKKFNIDHWAISSDNKLLHWGPISETREESDEIYKEASEYATRQTGVCRDKIHKASDETIENWYHEHRDFLVKMFSDMPSGWYLSSADDINGIIERAIKF